MSSSIRMTPAEYADCTHHTQELTSVRLPAREAVLGEGMKIRRLLPHRAQRMIGAWCFFDHAGPADVSQGQGVRVGPHPHTGLQTFSWMVDGEILHRDSLGYKQLLTKGQVNLMTAGKGISHSEESPAQRSPTLQLAQFWIALPDAKRFMEPAFEHYPDLPRVTVEQAVVTVLVGELFGQTSPVAVHSPLVGADITTQAATQLEVPLNPDYEYGIAVLTGDAQVGEEQLEPGTLLYLGKGRRQISVSTSQASQIILIGGEPFAEEVVLYWNFVARSLDEVRESIQQWHHSDHFGTVQGYDGPSLPAPDLK
ncbi:pirin family protein [Alcaligenes endophyticus]|uniref:Pirin family protein n=1 Tax=Alcaligenes endophyticus TaxID=1929088 RepID=A0ABT8EKZ3_9BURK|nr:pirin family protein [Alcaligenes endophyticus]MCX5590683.1 pirin family protein [Alcaligenes endophyticus]MDN4121953.1 pirin family protein [Alcaligenes endophyticus]